MLFWNIVYGQLTSSTTVASAVFPSQVIVTVSPQWEPPSQICFLMSGKAIKAQEHFNSQRD